MLRNDGVYGYEQTGNSQSLLSSYPFKRQSHKMVKHIQTIRRRLNCLSVPDHFVGLALIGLKSFARV